MKPNRDISDGPWCWQNKAALRAIREGFEEEHGVTSALAVYLALTELASDRASETFQTTHAWIAGMTGLAVRTVQNRIKGLAELGLVTVVTPKLRAPSAYTLHPSGNSCRTSGNGCATFGNSGKQGSLPTLEEREEREETEKKLPKARERDPIFDALAAAEGSKLAELTKRAAGAIGVAAAEIRKASPDVTPEEVARRAANYRCVMPRGATLTASALAKHWPRCGVATARREQPAEGFMQ